MKISTNSFGNYKPVIKPNENIKTRQITNEVKTEPKITNEEKKFFSKLYPEKEEQITNYHFYKKDGAREGVSLGSLFDKRG